MPFGFAPRVGFPAQEDPNNPYAGGPDLSAFMDLIGTLTQQADQSGQMPGMAPEPVPGRANPFASMAAIFSSTLADQLGARGSAESVRGQLAQQEQNRLEAQQRNRALEQVNMHQRQVERIGYLQQISEAKLKMAQETGDWKAAEAAAKQGMSLENLKHKHDTELEELRQRGDVTLAGLKKKEAAPEEQQAKVNNQLLKFQKDTEGILSSKGSMVTEKKGGLPLVHWGGQEISNITPAAVKRLQNYSYGVAQNSGMDASIRELAVNRYLDTIREDDGTLAPTRLFDTEEGKRILRVLQQLYPMPQDQANFLRTAGLVAPGQ